ncbi:MAG: extracellular solute-binding protein [Pseudomonadota bacterium]
MKVLRFAAGMAVSALLAGAAFADGHVVTSHGISSFGDLKYGPDFEHFDYVNPNAPQGGTITFMGTGASRTFDSLNPFILKGEAAQGLGLLHDSLLTGSSDEPDSSYAYVAESIEYPEDRSWVIFKMRPEARFSDGHPITADDVVFSLGVLKSDGHPLYAAVIYRDIETAEALDEHTVKFTFADGANMRDLPATAGGIPILPEHYYETVEFGESTLDVPVHSGGLTVNEFEPGRYIEYCKIDDYWAEDLPYNVGTGNFDCYRYEYFSDTNVAFEAFKAGEYIFHEEFSSLNWATKYDFPALNKGWVIREQLPDLRPSGTQGFWINLRREKFQDPRVREALGYMFNFEWSNDTLFYGLYSRTDSFWENSMMQAEGLPEGEELALLEEYRDQLPESVFAEEAYVPPVFRPDAVDRRAIRNAGRLLDEAGWTVDGQFRTNAAGETLSIEILDDSPVFERIINPIIDVMRRAGVDAKFTLVDPAQMQARQKDYDFDLMPGRLVMSLSPGPELERVFGSVAAETPDTLNFSGVADPVVDDLIKRISKAETREEVEVIVRALDRVLRAKHIWIPNWYNPNHNVAYWDVFGRPDTKPPYSRGVISTWWFDQEKLEALQAEGAL